MADHFGGDIEECSESTTPSNRQLRIQLSLLGDHALANESAYDDLYTEDAWKHRLFRRYRQASGLSPLGCLNPYQQLTDLQQLQLTAEERLKAHNNLENRILAMKSDLAEMCLNPEKRRPIMEKCDHTLRWLAIKRNDLATKQIYDKIHEEIEAIFCKAFDKPFT